MPQRGNRIHNRESFSTTITNIKNSASSGWACQGGFSCFPNKTWKTVVLYLKKVHPETICGLSSQMEYLSKRLHLLLLFLHCIYIYKKYISRPQSSNNNSPRWGRWRRSRWIHPLRNCHSRSLSATSPSSTEEEEEEEESEVTIWISVKIASG